ncbi:MAG: DinB family protein [Chloroflexi bacterium]|nr:DinB family protein [Chloroflexota bacterium]
MPDQNTLAKMLDELRQTQQGFLAILDEVNEDILYRRSAGDESWTLAEVMAHITEARQFWSDDVRKIQATPGIKVGRTAEHPGRLQAVREHSHDSLTAFRDRLATSYEVVVKTLNGVTEEDLQLKVEHITFGPQTLAEFIQRLIVAHDQVHVEQVRALLTEGSQTR